MTQQPQPGNPNFPPNGPENQTSDPYEFFTVENIEDLREAQKEARAEEMQNIDPFDPQSRQDAEDRAAARYNDIRHDYMMSFDYLRQFDGMDPADPNYALYETISDHLGQVSIDQMGDDEWVMGQMDAQGNQVAPSGREMVTQIHDDELADQRRQEAAEAARLAAAALPPVPNPNNDPTQNLHNPDQLRIYTEKVDARNEAHAKLLDARDALAAMTAKRQGKLIDSKSIESEYRAANRAYTVAMLEYGRAGEAMLDAADPNRTDDQRKAKVVEYLLSEGTELRKLTNEKWDNTKVNKICKWMAKGNVAQRVLKGIAVGGSITAATALVTMATAGTAGGAAVGGAAATAGMLMRGMRTYGAVRGSELNKGNQDTTMAGTEQDVRASVNAMFRRDVYAEVDHAPHVSGSILEGAIVLNQSHEEAIKAEQKKNRRATLISVGSIALGTGLATGAAVAADHMGGISDKLQGMWHNLTGGKPEGVGRFVTPTEQEGGGKGNSEGTGNGNNEGKGNDEGRGNGEGEGNGEKDSSDKGGDGPDLSPGDYLNSDEYKAMADIDPGMGGIALFKELGLDASDWYKHEEALLKGHPDEFYRMSDGHVGITNPGKLSDGAMIDIAARTGILK